jgi:hypothetical protein
LDIAQVIDLELKNALKIHEQKCKEEDAAQDQSEEWEEDASESG